MSKKGMDMSNRYEFQEVSLDALEMVAGGEQTGTPTPPAGMGLLQQCFTRMEGNSNRRTQKEVAQIGACAQIEAARIAGQAQVQAAATSGMFSLAGTAMQGMFGAMRQA